MESRGQDLNNINRPAYDYKSAAEWLRVSERKLHRLVEERRITCVKLETEVRFRQIDLDQYVLGGVRPVKPQHQLMLPPGVGTS